MKDMTESESINQLNISAEATPPKSEAPTSGDSFNRPEPPPFNVDYDLISYIEKGQKPIRPPTGESNLFGIIKTMAKRGQKPIRPSDRETEKNL